MKRCLGSFAHLNEYFQVREEKPSSGEPVPGSKARSYECTSNSQSYKSEIEEHTGPKAYSSRGMWAGGGWLERAKGCVCLELLRLTY